MALVKGKCPNCGELIEVESSDFNVICRFCGVPFFPSEAIEKYQNYVSQLSDSLNIDTVNVNADNIGNYATLGLTALKEKNHEKCGFYADDILKRQPSSPEGLLLKAFFVSDNYSKEEGLRYYFLALMNVNNDELCELIIATLKEEMFSYSVENFTYLFDELKKYEGKVFDDIYTYSLMVISSELDDESIIKNMNINIHEIEDRLNVKAEDVYCKDGYRISKINDSLIYSKNDIVRSFFNIDEVDKKVEKYQNKKDKLHAYTYYLYLGERIIQLNLIEEVSAMEQELIKYHKEIVSIHSGCYVATCVYGSYNSKEVWVLRRFRDYTLDKNIFGRLFIKLYYFISPTIISLFGNNKLFRKINYKILNSMVKNLMKKGYMDTPYRDKER